MREYEHKFSGGNNHGGVHGDESEDGDLRDGGVWSEDTNIYGTMSVLMRYKNGVTLNYSTNSFLPYEGLSISFNATKGRLD